MYFYQIFFKFFFKLIPKASSPDPAIVIVIKGYTVEIPRNVTVKFHVTILILRWSTSTTSAASEVTEIADLWIEKNVPAYLAHGTVLMSTASLAFSFWSTALLMGREFHRMVTDIWHNWNKFRHNRPNSGLPFLSQRPQKGQKDKLVWLLCKSFWFKVWYLQKRPLETQQKSNQA